MQRYSLPPTINEQEKIIGGVLTVAQAIFLGIAFVCGFGLAQFGFNLSGNIFVAIICGAVAALPGIGLAFLKKHDYGDMPISQYLIYRFFFNKSKKEFPNVNQNFRR